MQRGKSLADAKHIQIIDVCVEQKCAHNTTTVGFLSAKANVAFAQ